MTIYMGKLEEFICVLILVVNIKYFQDNKDNEEKEK